MTAIKVDLLRLMLPPIHASDSAPIRCAWRLAGKWQEGTFADLAQVAGSFQPKRLEVSPHPADVSMTDTQLPPLPAKKLRSAVYGAIELLALSTPAKTTIGHSPRNAQGRVTIAWMAMRQLVHWQQELERHGLRADAVYPPPAFLPLPESSQEEGAASAIVIDGWTIVRLGIESGLVHPLPQQNTQQDYGEARIRDLAPGLGPVHWLATGSDDLSIAWSGSNWSWSMPMGGSPSLPQEYRWIQPVMGWGVTALLVWLVGLNIHAQQVEDEGQALKRDMVAQVKSAFPELSVVLNPLQQARQMRDARNAGGVSGVQDDFTSLVRASSTLLTKADGQMERLEYKDGQLKLLWREGAALKATEMEALQAQASERGLALTSVDGMLHMHALVGDQIPATTPAVTPVPAS